MSPQKLPSDVSPERKAPSTEPQFKPRWEKPTVTELDLSITENNPGPGPDGGVEIGTQAS